MPFFAQKQVPHIPPQRSFPSTFISTSASVGISPLSLSLDFLPEGRTSPCEVIHRIKEDLLMIHIIAIMLFGVLLGYRFRDAKFTQKTEKTISLTIISLLFILGLSIGSNDAIVNNLYTYGSQAIVLAVFGLTGSILVSGLVYKFMYKKGGK